MEFDLPFIWAGIILALVFRGVFIVLGSALIENFSWVFYIFGAFLVFTAIQQVRTGPHDEVERFVTLERAKVVYGQPAGTHRSMEA